MATTMTMAPTQPPNGTCVCGTGAKPNITFTARKQLSTEEHFDTITDSDMDKIDSSLLEKQNDVRIVQGAPSKENGWPWMVGLIQGFSGSTNTPQTLNQFCGGTLINSQFVVTAAHCFTNLTTSQIISQVSVLLGTSSIASNVTSRSIARLSAVNIHSQYNSTTFDNDIAVLKLAVPVKFSSTIRPICLTQKGAPFNGSKAIVVGWGTAKKASDPKTAPGQKWLREAVMQVIPKCPGGTRRMICALGLSPSVNVSSPCFGDSGGPLMVYRPTSKTFTLIGIVSNGNPPCGTGNPIFFTRVGSFISYIKGITNGTSSCSNPP
ncbi:chymotrypsinogen A isoform X2 [Folsomia candida]|nr:chymotrypsinogen A isoform X2 [Folsomia candida]